MVGVVRGVLTNGYRETKKKSQRFALNVNPLTGTHLRRRVMNLKPQNRFSQLITVMYLDNLPKKEAVLLL